MTRDEILKAVTAKPQSISELTHLERDAKCLKTAHQILTMFSSGELDRDEHGRYFPRISGIGTESTMAAYKHRKTCVIMPKTL